MHADRDGLPPHSNTKGRGNTDSVGRQDQSYQLGGSSDSQASSRDIQQSVDAHSIPQTSKPLLSKLFDSLGSRTVQQESGPPSPGSSRNPGIQNQGSRDKRSPATSDSGDVDDDGSSGAQYPRDIISKSPEVTTVAYRTKTNQSMSGDYYRDQSTAANGSDYPAYPQSGYGGKGKGSKKYSKSEKLLKIAHILHYISIAILGLFVLQVMVQCTYNIDRT